MTDGFATAQQAYDTALPPDWDDDEEPDDE